MRGRWGSCERGCVCVCVCVPVKPEGYWDLRERALGELGRMRCKIFREGETFAVVFSFILI